MKRALQILFLMLVADPASAHGHCIDHHWFLPEYIMEIRLQLTIIGICMATWAVMLILGGLRRARR